MAANGLTGRVKSPTRPTSRGIATQTRNQNVGGRMFPVTSWPPSSPAVRSSPRTATASVPPTHPVGPAGNGSIAGAADFGSVTRCCTRTADTTTTQAQPSTNNHGGSGMPACSPNAYSTKIEPGVVTGDLHSGCPRAAINLPLTAVRWGRSEDPFGGPVRRTRSEDPFGGRGAGAVVQSCTITLVTCPDPPGGGRFTRTEQRPSTHPVWRTA
jgi:hypothetical protein